MDRTSPHTPLSSKENKAYKFLASLSDAKVRKKEQAFLIEGVKMVEEALRDKTGVRQVIAATSLTQHHGKGVINLAEKSGVPLLWISDRLMDQLSDSKTPQPVMALVEMPAHTEEQLIAHSSKLIVLCHQLQDPGNLGTILRTAEAAGASGVAIAGNTVDAYNPKTLRASMGSILRLPVVKVGDVELFVKKCADNGLQTAAMTLGGGITHYELDMRKPLVVIVGQEGAGLPEKITSQADHRVRIPMAETIESLNAATSVAVFLYEALRQRSSGS
ncbi:MAG: RNA methyltransferase [Nitrospirota bacterium]|nr:RNA methyltransferase [Nitrospirota bacterium]